VSEHDEQSALFTWARGQQGKVPELALLFAIPNGGQRHKAVAGKLWGEGVKSGVPDVLLPVGLFSKGDGEYYGGLFIEMKVGRNKPTENQLWWHEQLRECGYKVVVCYSWLEAQRVICEYLGVPELVIEK
jgi:hypothetical protein